MLNNISDWLGMTSPSPETLAPSKSQQKLANVLADRHEDSEPAVNGAAVSEAADSIEQKLYGEPPLTFAPPSACRVSASTHAASSVQHHAPSLTPLHIQHQQYFIPRCAQIVFQISTSKFKTPPFFPEEHTARLKAEAAEEHAVRRLTVAQEQLVEYAQQQAADAATILQNAHTLETLLANALAFRTSDAQPAASTAAQQGTETADADPSTADAAAASASAVDSTTGDGQGVGAQLRACMESLRERLLNVAGEADTFAAQQKADLARSKRSLSQVRNLICILLLWIWRVRELVHLALSGRHAICFSREIKT